jgi:ribulose-5-phosphate 4-epimerase/fuculose-1-phosphate aldolase
MNPKWQHFASIRASRPAAARRGRPGRDRRPDAPDASAWTIHGTLHRARPDVRVVLHCHPPTPPRWRPEGSVDAADRHEHGALLRRSGDRPDCGGIADDAAEGARIAAALGNHSTLLMANHGLTCTGATVAQAFEQLYFFEKAAQTLLLALGSGRPLAVMSDAVAARTAEGWKAYAGMADAHFAYLKSVLDREEPDYRD